MKSRTRRVLAPIELIVELFVIIAIFAALVASFLIVINTFNSQEAAVLRHNAEQAND